MDAAMAMPTRRMDMWFAGTAPQGRLTVFFRIILAIPQFFVLIFLYIAVFFVAVIGWFAALFLGRLPMWAHGLISDVLRWTARVDAYMFLLTDRYPPFSFEDVDYPVRPFFPTPGPLNRVAVFFRIILVFPAGAFAQLVRYGLTLPLLIVMWFVVLFTGTLPPTFYVAYSALLRYEVRLWTYFLLLTSEYPWGMLGDYPVPPPSAQPPGFPPFTPAPPFPVSGPVTAPPTAAPAPGEPYAYPTGTAGTGPGAPEESAVPPAQPGGDVEGGPPVWPPPMPPPTSRERMSFSGGVDLPPWGTLVVAGAARGWMIFAIVWGSALYVGQSVIQRAVNHNTTTNNTSILGNTGNTGNTGNSGNSGNSGNTGNTP
jgi:hypothetical protein